MTTSRAVVMGGGPVGMSVAAMLQARGVSTLVVEADAGYCTGSRAICISRRSLEMLAWIGADTHVTRIGLPWVGGRSYFRDREVLHFTMASDATERFAPMVNVQQYHVEEAAHRALERLGGSVLWSTRAVAIRQRDDRVEVDLVDDGGSHRTIEADWLVACDGGRSTARECLGVNLEGMQYEGRYVIVDIEQSTRREVERLAWFDPPSNPGSTILMHRQPGNVWRIDYQIRDDEDPDEAIKPDNVLPRVRSHLAMIGETAPWKPLWISIYNAKCLTLSEYRHGRVLFAGDAAHLVPIFGVRGLNSGLDDAGNLAWKLAAVVHGQASPALLDTYTAERLHAARENIAYGAKSTEFMAPPHAGFSLMRDAALRLALERPDVASLINPRQSSPIAYPMTRRGDGDAKRAARPGEPAPEAMVEHDELTHLTQCFGHGFAVLTFGRRDATDAPLDGVDCPMWRIARDGAPAARVVVDRSGDAFTRYDAVDGEAILVRPDGYVADRWSAFDPSVVRDSVHSMLWSTVAR